jgi:uncharacterized repeat protein (TIGR01451 family)
MTRRMTLFNRWIKPLLAVAATVVMLTHAPLVRAEVFYGITVNGIFSVDAATGGPATQVVTFAAPLVAGVTLATRPSDGMLFYLDDTAANPNLWRWDPGTPAVMPVLVGTPGATTTGVIRLGFDVAGDLFAMNSGVGTVLWKLDPNTGAILSATPASGFNGGNLTGGGDVCLHPTTGVLYMVSQQSLYTLTSSGVVTLLGAMTGLPGNATGCAFDRNGRMVVSPSATLYAVNIGTLVATALPNATGVTAFGDLATNPNAAVTADLRVTKTTSNATPGTTVSFTVSVINDGPSRATDVRVLDLLPAGLTFVSAVPSQGVYSAVAVVGPPAYPAGTWRVGTLNNGATATLTINASVTGTTPITNWAQVSYVDQFDPDSTPGSVVPPVGVEDDQASVTITPSPDIQMVKTATSSFAVGTNSTYSLAVNNTLGSLTTGANTYTVTDVLPSGLTFVAAIGTGWTCALNTPSIGDNVVGGQRMVCTSSAAMAAGAGNANAITLTVLPAAAAVPSVTNTATVSGGGEPASNNGNNSSTIATAVCSASCPDLQVVKTSAASFTVGSPASYTLSVKNVGGLSTGVNNYVISDTLPTGLTLTTAVGGAGWTVGLGWTCTVGTAGGNQVTCNSSTAILPSATSTSIVFPVTVANTAAPSVTNTASVSGGGEPAAATGNNATSRTTVVIDFDLIISKTSPASFTLGTNGVYTITVSNIGALVTSGIITVTDTLPAGLTFVSGTGNNWNNCTAAGQVVTCTRPAARTIAAGSVAVPTAAPAITLTVSVGAAAAPSVSNTASVSDPSESLNLLANNSSAVTTPVDAPDLVVTKSHNGNFTVGVNGIYTLTVSNIGAQGTSTANVVVTDTLPAGLTFVSGTGTGWNACTAAGQVVTCVLPLANPIAAFSSAPPITLTVSVAPAAATASPVTNTVSVAGGNEPAGNSGNNSNSDITGVFYSPVITKAFSPATIVAGGTSTLTLTITNPAGNTVSLAGLAVVDPFPPGMSVAAVPAFSNTCGGTVSPGSAQGDTLISLTGGATGVAGTTCTIQVNVTSTTIGANVNTTGQVNSTNSGTGATASATLTVTAPGSPTLTMVSSPDPVGVNMPVTLTYTINNNNAANTNLGFIHNFPIIGGAQMVWQSTVSNTCTAGAASITNPAGTALVAGTSTGIRLFNGYAPAANAVCTIVITATVGAAGTVTTINGTPGISGLTGTALLVSAVNDTFNVRAVTLTKTFTPPSVAINTASLLTFLLTNGVGNPSQGGTTPVSNLLAFTETLPAGLVVASAPVATQCNGTVAATVGTGIIAFSGGTLSLGQASCSILVNVLSATAATYNNLPANVTLFPTNIINSATATLIVGAQPSLVFMKTVAVLSDPFNGGTNPKNIPGAIVLYTLRVTNTGAGTVDSNTLVIADPIPANTELFVGDLAAANSGPVAFAQGTPTSALSWTYTALSNLVDDVGFSNVGCSTWTYVPTPPFDPAVNCIRLNPKGVMSGTGGGNPYFDLSFRVRIK